MTIRVHKTIRTSKIFLIPFEELQNILDTSSTFVEVLSTLGYDKYNGNHRTLKKRINSEPFNMEKFNANYIIWRSNHSKKHNIEIPLYQCLVENSTYNRRDLKIRLVKENLMEYKCKKCGLEDTWQNEPISLQLEHINGMNNDNRLENLCFLCPNCHSQTRTFGGRNARIEKEKTFCQTCKKETKGYSNICVSCSSKNHSKFEVIKEELQKLIFEMPMTEIGKKFGVSSTSIKKRCKSFGIDMSKNVKGKWINGKPNLKSRKFHVTKEELEILIEQKKSWNELGKLFEVCGMTVKDRAESLGIILPETTLHPNYGKLQNLIKEDIDNFKNIEKLNLTQIAKKLGVSHASLRRKIKLLNADFV